MKTNPNTRAGIGLIALLLILAYLIAVNQCLMTKVNLLVERQEQMRKTVETWDQLHWANLEVMKGLIKTQRMIIAKEE